MSTYALRGQAFSECVYTVSFAVVKTNTNAASVASSDGHHLYRHRVCRDTAVRQTITGVVYPSAWCWTVCRHEPVGRCRMPGTLCRPTAGHWEGMPPCGRVCGQVPQARGRALLHCRPERPAHNYFREVHPPMYVFPIATSESPLFGGGVHARGPHTPHTPPPRMEGPAHIHTRNATAT